MKTYEFHGSVRIVAESESEAYDIFDKVLQGYDKHINDIEELD